MLVITEIFVFVRENIGFVTSRNAPRSVRMRSPRDPLRDTDTDLASHA